MVLALPPPRYTITSPLLAVGCTLGEGPIYDPRVGILHFVDILERKVYHLDPTTLALSHTTYPEMITCLALHAADPSILACAAQRGFGLLHHDTLTYLAHPSPALRPTSRFNDGACDSAGRFFAGTMYDAHGPGELYSFSPSPSSSVSLVDPGPFTDSNGLGWTPDERTLYFTDSRNNIIYAYEYDVALGRVANRRVFVDASGLPGTCDGLCVDTEGGVWSARWEGSCIVRFTPGGEVDFVVSVPGVWRVTACCFGGPKNDQLYVTSAHCGDDEIQARYPQSGHLFTLDLEGAYVGAVRGMFKGALSV